MGKSFKYKVGDRFGNWTLLSYSGDGKWLSRCDCGTEKDCFIDHLTSGNSKRCRKCYGESKRTSAYTYKSEYMVWSSMRDRCLSKTNGRYHQYGGRGIAICPEWDSFEKFLSDMGPRPKGTSIDRIDVDGPYNKENCRWATAKQQMRNRRINKLNGLGKSIAEAAEDANLPYSTLQSRLKRGWNVNRALSEPLHDKSKSVCAIAREAGLPDRTILSRVNRGWSLEDAISKPVIRRNPDLSKLARQAGLALELVSHRIWRGWSMEKALSTPPMRKVSKKLPDTAIR